MNFPSRLQLSPEWGAVESVASALLAQGFKAYLAGGSVRDTLLGETPKDFDLVTDATEDQLRQLFPKSYSVGKSFGVLIVPLHGTNLEVAQFRKEGSYLDGRHPQSWQRATPEEDAQRRDFTVNALFYDLKTEQVIDHVGGLQDLQAKILRCVGNPQVRLAEDRLRLFRAVRLAAQLGFQMEFATEAALRKSAQEVFKVSAERKKEEFLKLLGSRRPHVGLQWMAELNWLSAWGLGLEVYADPGLVDPVYGGLLRDNALGFLEKWALQRAALQGELTVETLMLAVLLAPLRGQGLQADPSLENLLKEEHKLSGTQARNIRQGLQMLLGFYGLQPTGVFFWEMASRTPMGVLVHELLAMEESLVEGQSQRAAARSRNYEFRVRDLPEMWVKGRDLRAQGLKPSSRWGPVLKEAYRKQVEGELATMEQALQWVKDQLR